MLVNLIAFTRVMVSTILDEDCRHFLELIVSSNGFFQHAADGSVMALIWGASPQVRSDRRKDRVETNPEQLAAASAQAEISKTFVVFIVLKDLSRFFCNILWDVRCLNLT